MYKTMGTLLLLMLIALACKQYRPKTNEAVVKSRDTEPTLGSEHDQNGLEDTIEGRFSVPNGYRRVEVDSGTFQQYLRRLPLKKANSKVTYFDGSLKPNRQVYEAVVDLPIGQRDLHQCADAIIRLRAEYFFHKKHYDSIGFNFTNGFRATYARWSKGERISVSGDQVRWTNGHLASTSYTNFWKYLEMVFSYAGTASLEKEMRPISVSLAEIGDVFIQGGFPGHAVIIVDMAVHQKTGDKIVLLAQSYMPAQELQVLKNRNDNIRNPWYDLNLVDTLYTPEWTFESTHLRRFY